MDNGVGERFTITMSDSEKHVDACLTIAKELHHYFSEEGIATMSKDLKRNSLYIAMNLNEVVGFTAVHNKSNYVAEISWMAVKLEYHRQGTGSSLIERVVDDLRPQGIRVLEVKTLSADADYPPYEKTRRFYEKMGFMHLETIDPYPHWEPGSPCAIYVKIL